MLVSSSEQFLKTLFASEAELEDVVETYATQLFGSAIVYLSQTRISTIGGRGTIPDAIVLDVETNGWYLVEAERAVHGTWEHIAPQVSRHLAAVGAPHTIEVLTQLALTQLRSSSDLRDLFRDLGISELEAHGRLQAILRKPPTIAIPIDAVPKDLAEWAQTLRNKVEIWLIEKYVSTTDPENILYAIPDQDFPTLTTTPTAAGAVSKVVRTASQPYLELISAMPELIGRTVQMEYGPKGTTRRSFEGVLRTDGIELEGEVYSLSAAAVLCMLKAGSTRKTANGWNMWHVADGTYLIDLYNRLRSN